MTQVYFIDGKQVEQADAKVSVLDHGFLFGDSVYEVIRSHGGKLFAARQHLARLKGSAAGLGIELPWPEDQFLDLFRRMDQARNAGDSYLRVIVTRGVGELDLHPASCKQPTVIGIAKPLPKWGAELYTQGCKVVLAVTRRNLKEATNPAIKSGNYLNNVLAIVEARKQQAVEAVMLNAGGFLTECTTSNVFMVQGGAVHTPDLGEGLLAGVTRSFVLGLCAKLGIAVHERAIKPEEFLAADEAFITSTTRDVMPVAHVGDARIKTSPGPVTQRLITAYADILNDPANLL